MSSEHHPEIIIIKRGGSHEDEHHGGAWKIAFADFMTAMMAFFLVLWIINATDKNTKKVIAHYFNPVRLEEPSKANKGIQGTEQATSKASATADPANKDAQTITPETPTQEPMRGFDAKDGKGSDKTEMEQNPNEPMAAKPTMSESRLFSDPYGSLDQILQATATPEGADAASRLWSGTVDAFRDPFLQTPMTPGDSRLPNGGRAQTSTRPPLAVTTPPPRTAVGDAKDASATTPPSESVAANDATPGKEASAARETTPTAPAKEAAAPAPGKAPSPPVVTATATQPADKPSPLTADAIKALKETISAAVGGGSGPAIDIRVDKNGVLISLTDQLNFSMFALGSAEPQAQVIKAVTAVARALEKRPGVIVVRGHTDAHPYKSAVYDNWRLSSARAQMVYYILTKAGLPAARVERIEGYADHKLQDPAHPFAATNRRIEILMQEPAR